MIGDLRYERVNLTFSTDYDCMIIQAMWQLPRKQPTQ